MTDDLQQARVEVAALASRNQVRAEYGYRPISSLEDLGREEAHRDRVAMRAALAAADAHLPSVEQIAEEIAGHPIGSGYYQTTVGVGEAREMAEAIRALFGEAAGDE